MRMNHLAAAAAVATALSLGGPPAVAADMMPLKVKAPPPAAEPLDVHGFADVTFLNDYITPRGLLVTNTGLTSQILAGLVLDLWPKLRELFPDLLLVVAGHSEPPYGTRAQTLAGKVQTRKCWEISARHRCRRGCCRNAASERAPRRPPTLD